MQRPDVLVQLILMTRTITNQIYFEFQNNSYVQYKGLAMSTPHP